LGKGQPICESNLIAQISVGRKDKEGGENYKEGGRKARRKEYFDWFC
jgi:hypothetical protein